jgi:hypothetical protein
MNINHNLNKTRAAVMLGLLLTTATLPAATQDSNVAGVSRAPATHG